MHVYIKKRDTLHARDLYSNIIFHILINDEIYICKSPFVTEINEIIKLMSWTCNTRRLIRWEEWNIARDVISEGTEGIIQSPKNGSLLIAYSYITPRNVHTRARYFIAV